MNAATTAAPDAPDEPDERVEVKRPVRAKPFGNGTVAHGNVIKLKMDAPVERILGAQQPAGFTVVLPGRRSLEPGAPLASKDPRIASMRVSNESGGAELTVTFKDGVPRYQVRARGDYLELHLSGPRRERTATPSAEKTKTPKVTRVKLRKSRR